jgi:hypothetical protein
VNKLAIPTPGAAADASLALAGGPANADPKPPTDENGRKGCLLNSDPSKRYDTFYKHGSTIAITVPAGPTVTYRCNDGNWEAVKTTTIGGAVINLGTGALSVSDGGGTPVATQPEV